LNQLIESLAATRAPLHIIAALEMFQFQNSSADRLSLLSEAERQQFFQWCDARQLTLMLSHLCNSPLPRWVREAVVPKAARYNVRFKRIKRELFEIVGALNEARLEFVMLKGLSHSPALTPRARLRAQGDIDLWLRGSSVYKARDVLSSLGYVPLMDARSRHLAPMRRPSSWQWRGDLFDPEVPTSIELHYELWSDRTECIPAPGLEQFWDRKKLRDFDGHLINVLCDEDLLGFAALHLLLHLLHGDLPLQRAWEIARFLNTHVSDDVFWRSWRSSHPMALRQLETCVFHLVTSWLGCRSRQDSHGDFQRLPVMARSWLEKSSLAPLEREWKPNKSEVWLHLAFINNPKYEVLVLFRRLLPTSLPLFVNRVKTRPSLLNALLNFCGQVQFLLKRLIRHTVTFFPTLFDAMRWFWIAKVVSTIRDSRRSQ
jgi:hypothetical protein